MKSFNILLFLLLGSLAMASPHPVDKYKKTKRINKTYSVNSDAMVQIENSFGDVTVKLWDQNTVRIEVIVEVSGNDEARVNERLDRIDVAFSSSKSKISAESTIPSENVGGLMSLLGLGPNKNTSTRVDYIVSMPKNSPLDVDNDYGAVIIEKMNAPLKLSCDFGRLQIGQLLDPGNILSFDYTTNSHIDYMKGGSIKADFSKFTVHGADGITFSGDYTTANFGPLDNIMYNSDFSTISFDTIASIDGRGDYSTVKIGTVVKEAVLKADFGSISIKDLGKDFKNLNIKSDYTTVNVSYDRDASFNYECKTEFGTLKLDPNLTTVNSRKEMNEIYKEGYSKLQDGEGTIQINSSFGSVTLKSNN